MVLDAMTSELNRAFTALGKSATADDKQQPPYFLSYSVSDASILSVRAQYGALADSSFNHARVADVQVRVGSPQLDNTHGDHRATAVDSMQIPLGDDRTAIARSLWLATNTGYSHALDNYLRVKTSPRSALWKKTTPPTSASRSHRFTSAPSLLRSTSIRQRGSNG